MRVEELPVGQAQRADVAGIVEEARTFAAHAISRLAVLTPEVRCELWPHRSSDSCEPERDLRDAIAHLDQVLVRHTVPAAEAAV